MDKLDYRKELRHLYQASAREVVEVDVPPLQFLMVDGQGDPNTAPAWREAVEALFSLSYTLKFMVKKGAQALNFAVMPLEGLWWADDMAAFASGGKAHWKWTAMIMQPPCITPALVDAATLALRGKKNPPALDRTRFASFTEGHCAQLLHIGPFAAEGPSIERVHGFIASRGVLRGRHHEIYLSDISRAAPEKWKTIIRQPMQ